MIVSILVILLTLSSHRRLQYYTIDSEMAAKGLSPHSCSHCQRLIIDLPGSETFEALFIGPLPRQTRPSRPSDFQDRKTVVTFNFTIADLINAKDNGCRLSQWILSHKAIARHQTDLDALLGAYTNQDSGLPLDLNHVPSFALFETPGIRGKFVHAETSPPTAFSGFRVYAAADNIASKYVRTRPINQKVSSRKSFGLACSWLEECLCLHKSCRVSVQSFLPTRIIQIVEWDTDKHIRLRHTCDIEKAMYAAVSYCWGGDQPLKTTRNNLRHWEAAIPWQKIPNTIQDAITTSKELGMHLIWIDSLCIIQDDPDDVSREVSLMPEIYSHATVTIAASRASSVHNGFLNDRDLTPISHLVFELPYRCPGGLLGSVTLVGLPTKIPYSDEDLKWWIQDPLYDRGWALQERLLSPRVLDFGTHQLRWICRGVKDKEGYTDGWGVYSPYVEDKRLINIDHDVFDVESAHINIPLSTSQKKGFGSVLREWHELVELFTRLKLTILSDRILAISGIAERYGRVFRDEYLAGLWRFAFPTELLWELQSPQTKPEEYQGPSWSWVSVNSPVFFEESFEFDSWDSYTEVIKCQVQQVAENSPYGAIKSADITLRGLVLPAQLTIHESHFQVTSTLSTLGEHQMGSSKIGEITLDIKEDPQCFPVLLLEVCRLRNSMKNVGLVLRDLDHGKYKRLGIFRYTKSQENGIFTWLENWKMQEITIV